jgi:hypothetical protein
MGAAVLPPRALLAQLMLQLRASTRDAEAAEAEEVAMDQDAALGRQRDELEQLMEARRRALDDAIVQARAEAADAIADAHREVSVILAGPVEEVELPVLDIAIAAPQQTDVVVQPPINIVIDAEAFARVLATVLSERLPAWGNGAIATGPAPAAPIQPSLKHARHLDVFLIGVATLIVLVILAAWIG